MPNTRTTQVVTPASQVYASAEQQRQIAEALAKRATAPRDVVTGPTWSYLANGLTQLGEALLARKASKRADKSEAAADEQMRVLNDALINQVAGPSPHPPLVPDGSMAMPENPNVEKLRAALAGQDPRVANSLLSSQMLQQALPQAPEQYTLGPNEKRFAGSNVIASNEGPPDAPKFGGPVAGTIGGKPAFARTKEGEPGFFDDAGQLIRGFVPKDDKPLVQVSVGDKAAEAFGTGIGRLDAEKVGQYREDASSALKLERSLDRLAELNPTALSGGGAGARLAVANWIEGFTGIRIAPEKVKDSQQFNSAANAAVLDMLGGSLGRQISDADRKYIAEIVPKLADQREARQELIDYLRETAQYRQSVAAQAEDYARKNNGLAGWKEPKFERAKKKQTAAPDGIDEAIWKAMPPEDQALWLNPQ